MTAAKVEQQLLVKGGQPGNQNARKQKNDSDIVQIVSLGQAGGNSLDYIRARLKRDGKTELPESFPPRRVSNGIAWRV